MHWVQGFDYLGCDEAREVHAAESGWSDALVDLSGRAEV
jgi:hypothetical protein